MDAGVTVSLQTDKGSEQERCFREYGAFLVRHGLTEEQALSALTINGAKAMMLADRIGSIEVGKDADLVLLDGPPLDLSADRVAKVIVDGRVEYERARTVQTGTPTPVGPFRPMTGELGREDTRFAVTNAHIFTLSHGNIRDGAVVVDSGKFSQVGRNEEIPEGIPVLDAGGRVLLPGWVTARAFPNDWIGDIKWQVQNDEVVEPITPEMNARFAIDPWFPSFPVIRGIGITSQNITPGCVNLVGGSGIFIKTSGMDQAKMVRREPSTMTFSLTSSSIRYWGRGSKIPVTLDTASGMIRKTLDEAKAYQMEEERTYNQRLEALQPALGREVPVIIHALTEGEIREAMRIAADYDLRLIISGAVAAHRLAEELAEAGIGVILGDSASNLENIRGGGRSYNILSPLLLSTKGVKVSFFGPSASRRGMPTGRLGGEPALNAAWVFRNGVPEQEALRMFTLNAAEMLDMEERVGSIDVGKDADFMILEGHPFDYRVLPEMVFIDGRLVHQGPL
jgi:imidazolonepropionase-like amidohydrolase